MTWSNVPGPPPQSSSGPTDAQRAAWERGGTTLFPPAKLADRISTVLLLVFGAVMTVVTAIVGSHRDRLGHGDVRRRRPGAPPVGTSAARRSRSVARS